MPTCPECGKQLRTSQGLRGHLNFVHGQRKKSAETPTGVPPPQPAEEKRPDEELYKPYQATVVQPATQYTQYPPQQPYQQPYPPQPQPPQPQQPAQPAVIVKVDVGEVVSKELRGREEKAPAEVKKTTPERIRGLFAEHSERKRKWDDEAIKPLKESLRQTQGKMDELFEKARKGELYPKEAQTQPEASPPAQPQQPTEPPISADDLIREAKETARELATKKVLECLEAKEKGEGEAKPETEEGEHRETEAQEVEETQKEGEVKEISRPPEESQKEVPKEESPKHIFPTGEVGEK